MQKLQDDYDAGRVKGAQVSNRIKVIEDQARADLLKHKVFLDNNDPNIP